MKKEKGNTSPMRTHRRVLNTKIKKKKSFKIEQYLSMCYGIKCLKYCTVYSVLSAIYTLPEKWVFLKKRKTKYLYEQSQDSHYKSCYIK